MKHAFVADLHLASHRRFGGAVEASINRRFVMIMEALRLAIEKAGEAGCTHMFVLGDMFDTAKPLPQELSSLMGMLRNVCLSTGVTVCAIPGNHDIVSATPEDHALGPLRYVPGFRLYTTPSVVDGVVLIPYRNGPPEEWLDKDIELALGDSRDAHTLAIHLGISDGLTPQYLRGAHDSIPVGALLELTRRYNFRYVVAGNWHNYRVWRHVEATVIQCGALVPTGFDNAGVSGFGKVTVLDSTGATYLQVPQGPRFLSGGFDKIDFEDIADIAELGHSVFLSLRASPQSLSAAKAKIRELKASGAIVDGEVLVDRAFLNEAAVNTARMTRSRATVHEVVASYIATVGLPEKADRQKVRELVMGYLGT